MRWLPNLLLLSAALAGGSMPASAQNFAPSARLAARPLEALVGEEVTLDASASTDPDDGPSPLTFAWELGDGATGSGALLVHRYATTGLFPVVLRVSDGSATTLTSIDIAVLRPGTERRPRSSSTLALGDGDRVWAANEDSGSLSRVELAEGVVEEVEICPGPTSVAVSPSGDLVYATCPRTGEIAVVEAETSTVRRVPVGGSPRAIVTLRSGALLWVDERHRRLVQAGPSAEVERVTALSGPPYALAVDGSETRAFITRLRTSGSSARLMVLDLASFEELDPWVLGSDPGPDGSTSGRGVPNLLASVNVHPDGETLWVGAIKQNSDRGAYLSGEPLDTRSRLRGALLPVALEGGSDLMDRRIDTNDADSVSAAAFSPRGRFAFTVHRGAGLLSAYDLAALEGFDRALGEAVPFVGRVDVGDAPNAVLVDDEGSRALVHAALARALVVVDIADPSAMRVLREIALTEEPLPALVAEGKRLFHRSGAPLHSDQSYIACASCHPDGSHDGRVWDFTQFGEGLRNTIDLRGRAGLGHGPLHWSANFDEVQDFENDIVTSFGGTGLAQDGLGPHPPLGDQPNAGRSRALDALAAYVTSLDRFPSSPHRAPDGSLTPAAERGRAIFFDPVAGCADCHAPPRFTDSGARDGSDYLLHDVGTLSPGSGARLGESLQGLDTPTLLGVWDGAPYLHDGSASSLREVLVERNVAQRHGRTDHLDSASLDALVLFLLSLDGSPDEIPASPMPDAGAASADGGPRGSSVAGSGCHCTAASPPPLVSPSLALALLLLRRRSSAP